MAVARIGAFSGRKTTASAADQPVSSLLSRVSPAAGSLGPCGSRRHHARDAGDTARGASGTLGTARLCERLPHAAVCRAIRVLAGTQDATGMRPSANVGS